MTDPTATADPQSYRWTEATLSACLPRRSAAATDASVATRLKLERALNIVLRLRGANSEKPKDQTNKTKRPDDKEIRK